MKFSRLICISAIVNVALVTAAAGAPIRVDVNELLRHPRKYDGKQVSVIAYLAQSCEYCFQLFQDVRAARTADLIKASVALGKSAPNIRLTAPPRDFDGNVFVVGTFQHSQRIGGKSTGIGPLGMYENQITELTSFRILSRRIPLGRW